MFKKSFIVGLSLATLLTSISFGQDVIVQSGMTEPSTIEVKPVINEASRGVSSVEGFLFDESSNKYVRDTLIKINPGEEKKLRIKFNNTSNEALSIFVRFSDSGIIGGTKDGRSCMPLYASKNFVKGINGGEEFHLTIPAGSDLVQEIPIKFPVTMNGMMRGCMTYGLEKDPNRQGVTISFVRNNWIDIFVGGDADINSTVSFSNLEKDTKVKDLSSNKKIKAYYDESKDFVIEANLQNNGSLDEIVNISGTISNIFGYKDRFEWKDIKLSTIDKAGVKLSTKGMKIFTLPSYKGSFKVELDVTYKPSFDFDISGSNIDKKVLEGGTLKETANIFLMPWMALAIILVFLILVKLAFRKRDGVTK